MAYPAISNSGEKTIFESLHEQGVVDRNLFSFELGDSDEGELYLGGTDASRYEGSIVYSPVTQPACEYHGPAFDSRIGNDSFSGPFPDHSRRH